MSLPMTFSQSLVNPLEQPIEQHSKKSWGSCCKKRHIVMAVVAFKVLLMSALGSMFPLAVIAMVKRPNNTVNSTDCPINTNVTVNDSGGNEAPMYPGFNILFSSWLPVDERTRSAAYVFSAMILGTLIPMFTAGELMEKFGWPSVYYLSGLSVIPFMITWVFFVYDTPHHHPTISNEEKSYIIKNSQRDYGLTPPVPWLKIITSKPVWAAISITMGTSWISFTLSSELPTYLRNILHFNIKQSSFISALPHLANLASNVLCSTLSHWLRMKGFISQITAYRIFNFFATVGTAVAMIVVAQLGCNAEATVSVLVVTMTLNGAYFGGSFMNLLDLGSNFSGSLSAYSGTLIGTMTIVAPLITGAIINTNQTRSSWGNVFYVSAAVSTIPFFIFYFLGSAEEQPWNVIHKEEDEEAIVEVGPEDETNAYDPEH